MYMIVHNVYYWCKQTWFCFFLIRDLTVKPVYNGHPGEMARWLLNTGWLLYTGQLCWKNKAAEKFGKLSSNHNNGVTTIYSAVIDRFHCIFTLQVYIIISCSQVAHLQNCDWLHVQSHIPGFDSSWQKTKSLQVSFLRTQRKIFVRNKF